MPREPWEKELDKHEREQQLREAMKQPRDPEQPRYGAVNASRKDHIARLRKRARAPHADLRGVVLGILDLLEDDGQ